MTAAILLAAVATPASAGLKEQFTDPEDGWFDASTYLLERKGALPTPIVITEPALGYGGGAALVFFQQSLAELASQSEGRTRYRPPNVYTAAGAATEHGSWGTGGGGMVTFAEDRWRCRAVGAYVHLELGFYGVGPAAGGSRAGYTLEGYGGSGALLRRIGSSDAWVTATGQFLQIESRFDTEIGAPFPDEERRSSGLGPSIEYDSRDNIFTPSRGWTGSAQAMFYDPALGGDASFQIYRGHVYHYAPLLERFVLGSRIDGRSASGATPFYMLPYIALRGIPALRYQGEHTAVLEGELRWNATPRWALIGFGGAGRAWGSRTDFDAASTHAAGGTGFRYLIARRLGVHSGLDFAWGPEFAFYIQVGSAWH